MESSSIGLSVVVDGSVIAIQAAATWGEYHSISSEVEVTVAEHDDTEDVDPEDYGLEPDEASQDPEPVKTKLVKVVDWHRTPRSQSLQIDLVADSGIQEVDGVEISYLKRRLGDHWVVSVFLANIREHQIGTRPKDSEYLYQPTPRDLERVTHFSQETSVGSR